MTRVERTTEMWFSQIFLNILPYSQKRSKTNDRDLDTSLKSQSKIALSSVSIRAVLQ